MHLTSEMRDSRTFRPHAFEKHGSWSWVCRALAFTEVQGHRPVVPAGCHSHKKVNGKRTSPTPPLLPQLISQTQNVACASPGFLPHKGTPEIGVEKAPPTQPHRREGLLCSGNSGAEDATAGSYGAIPHRRIRKA
ncbi:hypothetical protein SKAU_G00024700 [Synaphobranchus kaupii]|uniref:Uncharacterized protein n=1 Tax=Synaphobranchus kaupii TaxID=118154 RepID=A0A9Q1GED5_SYNKA|nr:hypothetical protein SKAU_G00024700 [Synaphobranchus kaupii]